MQFTTLKYRYFDDGIGRSLEDLEDDAPVHRTSSVHRSNSSFERNSLVHARRKIGLGTNVG